ncbi:MAG: phosphoadenylyl-sulfate reductase [Spirochaetes bacterium]|nr:phosphoadenylyl-sulfate reductase [Spirochaetota bacterium]
MNTLASRIAAIAGTVRQELDTSSPRECVESAARLYGSGLVMTTSFGSQSAVLLHLATTVLSGIPVIWIDTGYLPRETYQYAERLSERLKLNLHVYQGRMSPARMEALHGRLHEGSDPESLSRYHEIRKVEPLRRALHDLGARAWMAGVRADQTSHRRRLGRVSRQWGIIKIHPLLNMTTDDVERYLRVYALPRHPLTRQGYATVGDWHSSRPVHAGDSNERATRFNGIVEECGIHLGVEEPGSGGDASLPRMRFDRV